MDTMLGDAPGIRRGFGPGRSAGSGVEEGVELSRDVIEAGIRVLRPESGARPGRYCGMFPQDVDEGRGRMPEPVESRKVVGVAGSKAATRAGVFTRG